VDAKAEVPLVTAALFSTRNNHMLDPLHDDWVTHAHRYYSAIGPDSRDSVTIFQLDDNEATNGESPRGAFVLRLQSRLRYLAVLDSQGGEQGLICTRIPRFSYVMTRGSVPVWRLTVHSVVRKRHKLSYASGAKWLFDTPFYWRQHVNGRNNGQVALLGHVGPRKRYWFFSVRPGDDTFDLLAGVSCLHRNWWHW
jgi:hypothetical protein